ncbi:MAG: hypothetical protein WBD86_01875 [Microgenomates group bacterium]
MSERPLLVRVKNLPHEQQCLKNPNYRCACYLSDPETRKTKLRELRQQAGAYSFINLLDEGVAEEYAQLKKKACEGRIPSFKEKVRQQLEMLVPK